MQFVGEFGAARVLIKAHGGGKVHCFGPFLWAAYNFRRACIESELRCYSFVFTYLDVWPQLSRIVFGEISGW